MAILTSEKLNLEIRFREIDAENRIHYDAWFRYTGRPIVDSAILNTSAPYWRDRFPGSFRACDEGDERLIETIREALLTNQPTHWCPVESGFDLYIYPQIFFPPTRKEDFDHPFDFSYILQGVGVGRQEHRDASGGTLPDDFIWIYARADLINFGEERYYSGAGIAIEMNVFRWELEAFLADLEAEYAEFLLRCRKGLPESRFENWKLPYDPAVKPVQITLLQGDLQGCIRIGLQVGREEHSIWAAHISTPFDSLVDFLIRVANRDLPCDCWIDEEGTEKILRGYPLDDPDTFKFELIQPVDSHFQMLIACVLSRQQFVYSFFSQLIDFINTKFMPDLWGTSVLVHPRLLGKIKSLVEKDSQFAQP